MWPLLLTAAERWCPDNNGISNWKRLTSGYNVITLGGWFNSLGSGFIVTLIRTVEPSVCLLPNLFKALPLVLPKWKPLQLMYLPVKVKTWPVHQQKRQRAAQQLCLFLVSSPQRDLYLFLMTEVTEEYSALVISLFSIVSLTTQTEFLANPWP